MFVLCVKKLFYTVCGTKSLYYLSRGNDKSLRNQPGNLANMAAERKRGTRHGFRQGTTGYDTGQIAVYTFHLTYQVECGIKIKTLLTEVRDSHYEKVKIFHKKWLIVRLTSNQIYT